MKITKVLINHDLARMCALTCIRHSGILPIHMVRFVQLESTNAKNCLSNENI